VRTPYTLYAIYGTSTWKTVTTAEITGKVIIVKISQLRLEILTATDTEIPIRYDIRSIPIIAIADIINR